MFIDLHWVSLIFIDLHCFFGVFAFPQELLQDLPQEPLGAI
jgi:hypothetical protein